jgi:uncharacterized RDD family membrane protein YckC
MDHTVRVGFWPRVGAALIDYLFFVVFAGIAVVVIYNLKANGRLTPELEYVLDVAIGVGFMAYHSFEIFKAATPGKMILGQRIVTIDGNAAPGRALVSRFAVKHFGDVFGLVVIVIAMEAIEKVARVVQLGLTLAALGVLGASRQALWDHIAGTIVMRTKDLQEVPGFQPLMSSAPQPVLPSEPPAPPPPGR